MSSNTENVDLSILSNTYTAESIGGDVGMKAIRNRPARYIGSTDVDGILQQLREIVENSIDEVANLVLMLRKENKEYKGIVETEIFEDGSVRVRDNGRGIPVGINKKFNKPAIIIALEYDTVGGKGYVDDANSGYKDSTGGTHGAGACVTNATCEYFNVRNTTTERGFTGHTYVIKYAKGETVQPLTDVGIIKDIQGNINYGFEVHFKYDDTIFNMFSPERGKCSFPFDLQEIIRLYQIYAMCSEGVVLKLKYKEPNKDLVEMEFDHEDYKPENILGKVVNGKNKIYYNLFEDNSASVASNFKLKVYTGLSEKPVYIHTTNRLTTKISSHQGAFKEAVITELEELYKKRGLYNKQLPIDSHFIRNLSHILILNIKKAEFTGQKKTEFRNSEVKTKVKYMIQMYLRNEGKQLLEDLYAYTVETYKENLTALQKREKAKKVNYDKQLAKLKKGNIDINTELTYPQNNNLAECTLICVEGNSARALIIALGLENVGVLTIGGKIPNVELFTDEKLFNSGKFVAIYDAIIKGWKRVIIMTDADADGAHIRLLVNGTIAKKKPEVIRQNRLYYIQTPLYEVQVKQGGNEKPLTYYIDTDNDFEKFSEKYSQYITNVKKNKGLASMGVEDAKILLKDIERLDENPNADTQFLVQISPQDFDEALGLFERYLGQSVVHRRAHVLNNQSTDTLYRYAKIKRVKGKAQTISSKYKDLDVDTLEDLDLNDSINGDVYMTADEAYVLQSKIEDGGAFNDF